QVRVVQADVFAAGLLVLGEDLAVLVASHPAGAGELHRATIAADQVIDADPVAHRPQHVHRHAARIFADHFEVVGQVAAIGPLPDAAHADHAARIQEIARLHDPRDAVNEQVGGDAP